MWIIMAGLAVAQEPESYELGVGDTLEIQVYQEDDLSSMYTISDDGAFEMPLLGRIEARGMSVQDLSEALASALGNAYLVNPQVSVRVEVYNSQPVRVLGSVNKPGVIYLTGSTTVSEILAKAGGVKSDKSAQELLITNEWDVTAPQRTVHLGRLLESGEGNLTLHGGDVVYVSEGQTVTISGEVEKPGLISFSDGMTVTEAIAQAGGAAKTANLRKVTITRGSERIPVNVKRILNDKSEDLILERDDQLFIRESYW
jgi:polysaccharide export outer membrane protein